MASGVAHDINNAICPVSISSTVLLKSEPDLSPRTREYLEIIQRAAKGVGDTVSRLRKFSRGREDPGVLAPMLVSDLVEEVTVLTRACWQDMAQERGAEIVLKTEVAPGLPPIAGIVSALAEALINLVFNAVDAMPDDGGMPKVDGWAVAASVKAAAPGTPVILLTGWGQALQEDANIPPGVDHILAKPVSPHDLFAALAVCRTDDLPTKTDSPQ